MTQYRCRNIIVTASCKEEAIKMFTVLSAELSLVDKLLNLRKELRKYFNIGRGSLDSVLQIKCNSEEGVAQLEKLITEQGITSHIKREYNVEPEFKKDVSTLLFKCTPETAIVRTDKVSLSLSEFLYVSRNRESLERFITKYNFENVAVTVGSNSVQGIIRLCSFLARYKNRLFVDFKKV